MSAKMDTERLWLADISCCVRALLENLARVDATTAKTQELVLPLGQLLDLLERPEDQEQDLGDTLVTALRQMLSMLQHIEAQQDQLLQETTATGTRLVSLEATLARLETSATASEIRQVRMERMIQAMSRLLLAEDLPLSAT